MRLPIGTIQRLKAAARPPRMRWWQMSLRTLFLLTAVFAVLACFWQPLATMAEGIWEVWFPSPPPPHACGPCGMG